MLCHILPALVDGPYGGGNQFAKALREQLLNLNHYTDHLEEANILIFNGYPFRDPESFEIALRWKQKKYQDRILISRIDGPIASIRHNKDSECFDEAVYEFCELAADGMIIQSRWSHEQVKKHPLAPTVPVSIIGNAPNPNIFHSKKQNKAPRGKIKVIASSWSANRHKGFEVYEWLDQNLDFSLFSFCVVGKTNIFYRNIRVIEPLGQEELSTLLRNSDVYITASYIESCSNASLEALHCGLPVIAPNASSHPEFMPSPDLLFDKKEDILEILKKISGNLPKYQEEIFFSNIEEIAQQYLVFATNLKAQPVKHPGKIKTTQFLKKYGLYSTSLEKNILKVKQILKNAILRK